MPDNNNMINFNMGNASMENYLAEANAELDTISEDRVLAEMSNNLEGLSNKITSLYTSAETIALNYRVASHQCALYSKVGDKVSTDFFDIDGDEYDSLCEEEFGIDLNEQYNYSGSKVAENGDRLRVFAHTKPISEHPCVTINVARKPLGDIGQSEIEKFIIPICMDNFLIVGATGSGKTYFLNNALMKTFNNGGPGQNNRIMLVEEFHELFEPNKHTESLTVPPAKPGQVPIFDYVISQTNLDRVQNIFVGEIKGREAWPFVLNLASGTHGGTTMHGKSCIDGINRLQMLMATAGVADKKTCGQLIAKAIKYVVYIEDHRIVEIQKLVGVFNDQTNKWNMEPIFDPLKRAGS